MKKAMSLFMVFFLFLGLVCVNGGSKIQDLQKRKDQLESKIKEHEFLVDDRNLLFVRWATLMRPAPLGDVIDFVMNMKYKDAKPGEIAGFVAEVIRQSVEYRKTVREQILPEIRAELESVQNEMLALSAVGESGEIDDLPVSNQNSAKDEIIPWHIVSEADRLISGHWVLTLDGKESIIYVTLDDKTTAEFTGILTVDRLQYFEEGEIVFRVRPLADNPAVFVGTEFSYDEVGSRIQSDLHLRVEDREMYYEAGDEVLKLYKR